MQGNAIWDGSVDDRLAEALELKNEGNACFKHGDAAQASAAYSRAIALLEQGAPGTAEPMDEDDKYDLAVLHANRAAAHLLSLQQLLDRVSLADRAALPAADSERGSAAEAERDARRAIVLAPAYAKGHQRLAKALAAQGDTAGARHASKTAKRLAKGLTAAAQSAGTTVASASAASAPSPAPLPSGGGGAAAVFPPGAPAPAAAASPPGVSPGAQLAAGSDVCALVRASCCSLFPTPAPANALVSVDDDAIEALFAPGTGVLAPAAASPTAVAAGAVGTAGAPPASPAPLVNERFESLVAAAMPRFPLTFGTLESEINFWCVLGVLNMGSGYRRELHAACDGVGAFQTVQRGVLSLFIGNGDVADASSRGLDGAAMARVSLHGVGQAFGIPYETEAAAEGALAGAVFVMKPTALKPLAASLLAVLHESAAALKAAGHQDFASLVLSACRARGPLGERGGTSAAEGTVLGWEPSARAVVRALVETVPAFRDAQYLGDRSAAFGAPGARCKVWLAKKAQLVAAHLHGALAARHPALFGFADLEQLTVFADNVLPAVLRALRVIVLAPGLAARIDDADATAVAAADGCGGASWLRRGEEEGMLRAAAVAACERIVARGGGAFDARQLDAFLWKLGKEPQYRDVARHATKDTVYY